MNHHSDNHYHGYNNNTCRIFSLKSRKISFLKGDTINVEEFNEEIFSGEREMSNKTLIKNEIESLDSLLNRKYSQSDNKLIYSSKIIKNGISDESETQRQNNSRTTEPTNIEKNQLNLSDNSHLTSLDLKIQAKGENEIEEIVYENKASIDHMFESLYLREMKKDHNENEFIYSWSKLHPFSFLTGVKKYGKGMSNSGVFNYPSPTFINSRDWERKPVLTKNAILQGMVIKDKEGLVLVDQEIMKKFKGIISDMIKQIIKSAFGTPISLKVQMFEPKSTLQRIADYWAFAPQFLRKAALAKSPNERMKLSIAFAIAGFYIPTKQLKPFNPLIGETFQGEYENGAKIYIEHISHYPTISRFLICDPKFKFYGYFDFSTETERFGSKINIHQKGPLTIEFHATKEKIVYNMPTIKLLNASSEEGRSSIWTNTMLFSDISNNLKAIVKFGTNKNYIHGFEGCIIKNEFDRKPYEHMKEVAVINETKLENIKKMKNNKILSSIKGSWLKELRFDDNELVWNIDTHFPSWIKPSSKVLPSDGRFREDVIWLYRAFNSECEIERKKFQDYSQGWKVTIEYIQRNEREIRKRNKVQKK